MTERGPAVRRSGGPVPATRPERTAELAGPATRSPGDPGGASRRLAELGSALPELLVSFLQRRYLADFDPSLWEISTPPEDGARPLFREVLGIGRSAGGLGLDRAMQYVLSAGHCPGQAVVMAVHGENARHRIYVGGRRMAGPAGGSTEDFLDGQAGLLTAHFPGLELGQVTRLGEPGLQSLSEFLQSAPALACVTGVPSRLDAGSSVSYGLDRLTAAVGRRRYALLIVAEPLDAATLDRTVDRCRRLRSDVHTLVRRTTSRSSGDGTTESGPDPRSRTANSPAELATQLAVMALFCQTVGLLAHASGLSPIGAPLNSLASVLRSQTNQPRPQRSVSRTSGQAETEEHLDGIAEACESLLQQHIDRLEVARGSGWWRTSIYVAAESDGALAAATAAVRAIGSGPGSSLDPMRVVRPAPHLLRPAMTRCQPLHLLPLDRTVTHPLGPSFDALATCMSSAELAVIADLPQREVPGLPMREVGEFALSAPVPTADSIRLGWVQDCAGRDLEPMTVSAEALNRHVFISGMTGYGKTTTAKSILLQAYAELGVPFLVIEPVKAEYRQLGDHPLLRGRLRVFEVGGGPGTLPLRLNPFRPIDGVPLLRHIDLLKGVFNAAFPMFAGMSYVLEEAMLELYTERGWDLHTSYNTLLGPSSSPDDLNSVLPALGDLYDKVEQILARKRYGAEIHQNLGAALRSRIGSLMVGSKGAALNVTRSISPSELFTQPCVIELRNLGDNEEKAFVMALVLGMLYQYAESRQGLTTSGPLQHLTLIEEAHRLLSAPRTGGGAESPEAQAKAVTMFTDMLAEMRSYGEGFIVADQIPTKLAPETLKNSNVKILHRLVAPDDRAVAGSSINLDDHQKRHLATLRPGFAVVHEDRVAGPVLVRMTSPADLAPTVRDPAPGTPTAAGPHTTTGTSSAPGTSTAPTPDRAYLVRDAACRKCRRPCTFLPAATRAGTAADEEVLTALFDAVLGGVPAAPTWRRFTTWRANWHSRVRAQDREPDLAALTYCALSQAGFRWLSALIDHRNRAVGAESGVADTALLRDRLARHVASFASAWCAPTRLDARAKTAHEMLRERLAAALQEAPPRELAGCAACPQRCRRLGDVAPLLPQLRAQIVHRVGGTAATASKVRAVAAIADPDLTRALAQKPAPADRRALLYCLVTVAGEGSGETDAVQAVLGHLRSPDDGSV